ncbi:IS3 family transposase, partial [Bacillus smithii]
EKWVTDITELRYGNGQYDHSIVAFKRRRHNKKALVMDTMKAALAILKDGEAPLIHSDRGFQYTSNALKKSLMIIQ